MSLKYYESRFSNLNLNRSQGNFSPHKVVMLLAVMDMIEKGVISDNRIPYSSTLLDFFSSRFNGLAKGSDRNSPHLPFFHLQSEGFWHFKPIPGKLESLSQLRTASSPNAIMQHVLYAYFDDELFELLRNQSVRDHLRLVLQESLFVPYESRYLSSSAGNGRGTGGGRGSGDWTWLECEACVADYFDMLFKEVHAQPYNKTEHRNLLSQKLQNRSAGSIEFKHQNISAILVEMGFPYISGYKPRFNYQALLRDVLIAHLAASQSELERLVPMQAELRAPYEHDWSQVYDPELPDRIPAIARPERRFISRIVNFAKQESVNRLLGESGEKFVVEFEQYRLKKAGRKDLAKEVEWSSKDKGDGLGYDIRSFSLSTDTKGAKEHFIEVKTTASGKYYPFYVSDNELAFSQKSKEQYSLYRVYDFRQRARLFQMIGSIDGHVNLRPEIYRADFTSGI